MTWRLLLVIALAGVFAASANSARHISSGAPTVRVVLAREQAAQNASHWQALYQLFDPVVRHGGCSYRIFYHFWHDDSVKAGITGRKGGRVRYSNIHVWTDGGGDYAFASYDMHIGPRFIGYVRAGRDSFIRRNGHWYDRFENLDYARECIG